MIAAQLVGRANSGSSECSTCREAEKDNDGTKGSVSNLADDFDATYYAYAFMSRQGCSSTAQITYCYTGILSGDPTKELETVDYKLYIAGGVGTNQRALLLSVTHRNTSGDLRAQAGFSAFHRLRASHRPTKLFCPLA